MVWSEARSTAFDYLGSHQHLTAEVSLRVDDAGGLHLATGAQRLYERRIAFAFPMVASGKGNVREWCDEATGGTASR
jgi:hypothetical protein